MRFSIITITFLLSVLFFAHMTQQAASMSKLSVQDKNIKQGKVVAAYFAGFDIYRKNAYSVEDIYPIAHKLTHIIYAFAKPNPQTGLCELQDLWADVGVKQETLTDESGNSVGNNPTLGGNFAKLLDLKRKFPHIKILLSIGGGTYSKAISAIAQKGDIKKFTASCIDLLDRYQCSFKNPTTNKNHFMTFRYAGLFDGIDVDWEWTNRADSVKESSAFVDMMLLLKNLLQKRQAKQKSKQLLTCAIQANAKVYKSMQLSKVVSVVDWFNVMAYDFSGKFSKQIGFNAPLSNLGSVHSIDNAIQGFINQGISPDKLLLGIPLYGQVFDQTGGNLGDVFEKTENSGALSYRTIKERYLQDQACEHKWHDAAGVPSVYCPASQIFVSFDNERSIQEKVKYAQKNRLKGIVLWRLAHDDQDHSLVHAI